MDKLVVELQDGEWVEGYYVKGLDIHDKEVHFAK